MTRPRRGEASWSSTYKVEFQCGEGQTLHYSAVQCITDHTALPVDSEEAGAAPGGGVNEEVNVEDDDGDNKDVENHDDKNHEKEAHVLKLDGAMNEVLPGDLKAEAEDGGEGVVVLVPHLVM